MDLEPGNHILVYRSKFEVNRDWPTQIPSNRIYPKRIRTLRHIIHSNLIKMTTDACTSKLQAALEKEAKLTESERVIRADLNVPTAGQHALGRRLADLPDAQLFLELLRSSMSRLQTQRDAQLVAPLAPSSTHASSIAMHFRFSTTDLFHNKKTCFSSCLNSKFKR